MWWPSGSAGEKQEIAESGVMVTNIVTTTRLLRLAEAGLNDPANAARLLQDLAGNGVTDDDVELLIPFLLASIRCSPDPDRALNSFARWFAAVGNPYSHLQTLLNHPVALEMFCVITGCSQYFADLLVRHPEYIEIITNRGVRGGTKTAARFQREAAALVDACQRPELKRDALRRWKAREMLRIGVRDLAGLSDMPSTAREFSNLADACVQQAVAIALAIVPEVRAVGNRQLAVVDAEQEVRNARRQELAAVDHVQANAIGDSSLVVSTADCRLPIAFSVIAMGKLGGQELNYSSDIDLMFVVGDDVPPEVMLENGRTMETYAWLTRVAETLIKVLNEETSDGHVFRVDMRLRPEGRFGSLVRSLSSYRAYYENWAENWERQALIKARPIAGDVALGHAFMDMITPFVYRPYVSADFIDDIRANKRKIAQKCALEGETETNIKTGYGGIRDIEFIVQLFQLEVGGRLPQVRTPSTLTGIQRLRHAGFLTREEARELSDDYQFLRALEHRLQLLHRFQTQTMPPADDDQERTFLARRMGFPDREAFEAELAGRRARVHFHLTELFFGVHDVQDRLPPTSEDLWADIGDLLDNLKSPTVQNQLAARLQAAGFQDIPSAIRALQLPMSGNEFGGMPPDTPYEFKIIAPQLLASLAASAQPDKALAGIEALALAVPNRAQLYASMDDSPELMARMIRLAAASPPLMQRLTQHLEWMEGLFGEEQDGEEESGERTSPYPRYGELSHRLRGIKGRDQQLETVARYHLRETLRIGARDAWDWDAPSDTMASLTLLAEEVLSSLLQMCADAIVAGESDPDFASDALRRVAVIGLGKLGGAELGYASDWDAVFVYGESPDKAKRRGRERSALAHRLVESVIGAIRSLATYGAGMELDLRLRPWGKKGALVLTPRAYLDYLKTSSEMWERQAAIKARFVAGDEALGRRMERIFSAVSGGGGVSSDELAQVTAMKRRIETERLRPSDRQTDLKLGYGGMSDIEWLAQKLQLENGKSIPTGRLPNTLEALSTLANAQILDEAEASMLSDTYQLLTRLRNGIWLITGQSVDTLTDSVHRRVLARRIGYDDTEPERLEDRLWADVRKKMDAVRTIFVKRFYGGQ